MICYSKFSDMGCDEKMMPVRDQMHNDTDGLYCLYAHTLNPPKFTSTPFLKLHTKTLVVSSSDDYLYHLCVLLLCTSWNTSSLDFFQTFSMRQKGIKQIDIIGIITMIISIRTSIIFRAPCTERR